MGAGSFPIDLLLFGMIAAFLVLRLRSILGRKDGFEPTPGAARPGPAARGPIIEGVAEPAAVPGRAATCDRCRRVSQSPPVSMTARFTSSTVAVPRSCVGEML